MQDYGGTITWVALESYTCGDNLTWTLTEDGVLNIRGTGDMYDYPGDVETPWSEYWDIIETVNIENGVTSIGDFAFWGCSAMTEVNIPDSVTRIGVGAFSDCSSLTGVEIPDSVTGIGAYAFSPCISLTEILVDEDNPNYSSDAYGVLFNKDKTTLICCPAGKTGEYKIPDSVSVIGEYAFESCEGLTGVEIGSSVTDIGIWGFGYCINLAEITFKGSVPAFSDDAFKMVTDVTAYYPAGNDTWTDEVRQNYGGTITWVEYYPVIANGTCGDNLTWTLTEDGVLTISGMGSMMAHTSYNYECWDAYADVIKTVIIENGITSIGEYAFCNCTSLTAVEIGNSVASIGDSAFIGCTGLTNVTIPDSVTSVGNFAFQYCSGIINVRIGDSVTDIGNGAFGYCSGLREMEIGDSVTSIGISAFYDCTSITSVEIPNSVTSIGKYAFFGCTSLTSVEVPDSVENIGECTFSSCTGLQEIVVMAGNTSYSSDEDGVLFNKEKNMLICYPGGKTGTYTIPDFVTSIAASAFYGCIGLTNVDISNSVTSVADSAFYKCTSLTSVEISNYVVSIGRTAFSGCTSLREITFKGDAPSIGDYAFSDVSAKVYYLANNETWTDEVRQNYGGTITWVAYEANAAMIGNTGYATLEEALTAAKLGDVVKLVRDCEATEVIIRPGVTLDLNGYCLTAGCVFTVKNSKVIDNSQSNTGVLKVDPDRASISPLNPQLPIWNGEGFIFTDILDFQEMYTTNTAGQKQYIFLPTFETIAHQYLVQGMENSRVKIAIRMTWEIETGSAFQYFVFNDKTVKTIIDSYANGYYSQAFYATITNSEYADFELEVVLISDTGVNLLAKESVEKKVEDNWIVPCNYTTLTSPFGNRDTGVAGASTYHQGIDLAAPQGTPVYASRSGTVTRAEYASSAGYYVSINHGDGFSSIYMHMTNYVVSAGQWVKQGDVIGYVGSTGIATGNHLHFGIAYEGIYVNPASYVNLS